MMDATSGASFRVFLGYGTGGERLRFFVSHFIRL